MNDTIVNLNDRRAKPAEPPAEGSVAFVLKQALDEAHAYESVIVIGWDKEGNLTFVPSTNFASSADQSWLLQNANDYVKGLVE